MRTKAITIIAILYGVPMEITSGVLMQEEEGAIGWIGANHHLR